MARITIDDVLARIPNRFELTLAATNRARQITSGASPLVDPDRDKPTVGKPVAAMVDGLSKLDQIEFATREDAQAESFRKMLLAMARDVRVILIKLADRLHNMRTLDAMAPAHRKRIARETIDIYVP